MRRAAALLVLLAAAPAAADKLTTLIANDDDTCVRGAGDWLCWGDNRFSQLGPDKGAACGTASAPSSCWLTPAAPAFAKEPNVALEGDATCVLGADRVVRCVGADYDGFLGRGDAALESCAIEGLSGPLDDLHRVTVQIPCGRSFAPVAVGGGGKLAATRLAVGAGFACAADDTGVSCWGSGNDGRLGVPWESLEKCRKEYPCRRTPTRLKGLKAIGALVLGEENAAAIVGGRVFTWGASLGAQLGRPGGGEPAAILGLANVTQVALGDLFGCALAGGKVSCWGDLLEKEPVEKPKSIAGLKGALAIVSSPASRHVCVITADRGVACWGENASGQLGVGDTKDRPAPTKVPGLAKVTALALGGHHSCALTEAGEVWCWGGNQHGQLGGAKASGKCHTGSVVNDEIPCATTPVKVPF